MILYRFLAREIRHSGLQGLMFILCVVLSIGTLTGLNSFKRDVNRSLLEDAQALHGGDIIAHSHYPFSAGLQSAIDQLVSDGQVRQSQSFKFYTVIRPEQTTGSLFASIKVVDSAFPFYGEIELASGKPLQQVLQPGTVVVAPEIFSRLDIGPGSRIQIGEKWLKIGDSVVSDPSQPISFFSFGPRIYMSEVDLSEVNLLTRGSRSSYNILLKIADPEDAERLVMRLQEVALVGQEHVETAQTARSGAKRFFDNLTFFLSFISIFTLLLSGIGMQSSLSAILRRKQRVMAIARAVGATNSFLIFHYLLLALLLGVLGVIGGVTAGQAIKFYLPILFEGVIPVSTTIQFGVEDMLEGAGVGFVVIVLFTFLPLHRISGIKPVAVLRHESTETGWSGIVYLTYAVGIAFLALLVIRQLEDVKNGIYFMLGFFSLIGLISLASEAGLRWLKSRTIADLGLRQALRSLYRPGNATRAIVVTLASALTLLLTIYLLEFNLFTSFIKSYPAGAPNLFCLDIQPDQKDQFRAVVGRDITLHPVVRARLVSINEEPVNYERERKRKSDSLAREFNLTFRKQLLEDEVITQGDRLFDEARVTPGLAEVSVLDTIADIGKIELHDKLMFNIQGVMLEAQVTSIRSRTESKLYPFFYFVFTEEVLGDAPQTLFAALHLEKEKIPEMINKIVAALPNVSTINAAETAEKIGGLVRKMSGIITFFSFFSILAGCLILVSAVYATRLQRIRESSYYKVLGGRTEFVLRILVYENTIIGLLSGVIALVTAHIATWALCRYVFEIKYQFTLLVPLGLVLTMLLAIVGIGLISSVEVMRQKPVQFLREYNGG
jgi:putative ABC transport system permease protein